MQVTNDSPLLSSEEGIKRRRYVQLDRPFLTEPKGKVLYRYTIA